MVMILVLSICLAVVMANGRFDTYNLVKSRVMDYEAQYYDAYIDNFDPYDSRTYKQRYYENKDEWNNDINSPIFLEIGGEGAITAPPNGTEEIAVLAKEHGALILSLEHRFYGASQPFKDLTLDHIKYLDDRQALEDAVHFIDYYDEKLHPDDHVAGNPKNKWVLFGGSYPGALASWIRTKYPHMSKCSVSSSGVVNSIYQFTGFDEQIYASAGDTCGDLLRVVTSRMESLVNNRSDKNKLFAKFGADADYDIGDFFYYMADSGVMAIQYGYTEELCDRLENASNNGTDLVDAYADYVMNWLNKSMNIHGADTYDRRVLADTAMPPQDLVSRQWQYQTCARFSWFQNAPASNSIRSTKYLQFDYFLDLCKAVFGIDMDPETTNVNDYYGGEYTKAPRVFYANYWQDPWHLASVSEDTFDTSVNSTQELVTCHNCAHCQDMYSEKDTDPEELKQVREHIKDFVNQCLA